MDLRQLRCFVRVVELGSLGRAAADVSLSPRSLTAEIRALEEDLAAPLLQALDGESITPTEAGIAFFREAQLTLRHAERALQAARESTVSGTVHAGLPPAAAAVLGLPWLRAMRERYPEVRLHLVESLSGHLASLLTSRRLDLALLYAAPRGRRWSVMPLVKERMFFIQSARHPVLQALPSAMRFSDLRGVPLILPSPSFEIRSLLDAAFMRARLQPDVVMEIDSLATLMDAVEAGFGATVQSWSATRRHQDASTRFQFVEILDREAHRACSICSLPNEELSAAAMAARVVLSVCAREMVRTGVWMGAEPSAS